MSSLRRHLASLALALTALQCALVFLAPVSACCEFRLKAETTGSEQGDCCPPGSHPPGQCPLHKVSKSESNDCRMRCATPQALQFLAGAIGVMPAPVTTSIVFAESPLAARDALASRFRPSVPDAPPPRSL